jgi:hypothetical protein
MHVLTIYFSWYISKMMSLMCKYVPECSFVHTYITMLPRNQWWWWLLVAFRGHASSLSSSLHISIYMYKSWPIWLISTWIQTWMYKVYAYVCTVLLSSLIVHHTASPFGWQRESIHCGNKISNLHNLIAYSFISISHKAIKFLKKERKKNMKYLKFWTTYL